MIILARWRANSGVAIPVEYGLACLESIGELADCKVSSFSFLPAIQTLNNDKVTLNRHGR